MRSESQPLGRALNRVKTPTTVSSVPVMLAAAMGAARQYGVDFWIDVDYWWHNEAIGHSAERFASAARILTGLLVSLVGLVVGGTMIVAGQLVSVLLDQRELLVEIHQALTKKAGPAVEVAGRL